MSDQTLLTDLPQIICDAIHPVLPELRRCERHAGAFDIGELKKKSLIAPSVLVSILGADQGEGSAGPAHEFVLKMAAYVVTKDSRGLSRDDAAANICQSLLQLIPDNSWGQQALGAAEKVTMKCLISGQSKDQAVALWAVIWGQPISLFARTQGPLGAELYTKGDDGNYEEVGGVDANG